MKRCSIFLFALLLIASVFGEEYRFAGLLPRDLTPVRGKAGTVGCLALDASCPIVYEEDDRGAFAAGYLASVLAEMTGREVTQYRLPKGATNEFVKCIYVPRPGRGEGFAVSVDGNGVRFSGRSDFAVFDFCERVLGARHYWDGPGGRSVPKCGTPVLPVLEYTDSPVFSFRQYTGGNARWFRVAKGGGTFDGWPRCHTTNDGFCYGSPEGLAEYCRRVDEDIAGGERFVRVVDRERKLVSVSPWDVAYCCRCPWCRTLKSHTVDFAGEASPILWERFLPRLVKHMAERHPDYRVSVLPYWNYVHAPKTADGIGTNVQAEVCSMNGLARFKWDRVREIEEGIILDWERVTGRKVANWHYSCWPADSTPAPYVYGHAIADHYRRMREHTVGSFICGGKYDFPRFSLSMYVWLRCLWNPELDVDAVYDEFCRRQFGAAAELMREVVRIQEEEWDPITLHFPPDALDRLAKLLNRSAKLVRGTSAAPAFVYYVAGFSGVFSF